MIGRRDGAFKDYARIVGMDPAANWLLGPGWHAYSGGEPDPVIPVIISAAGSDVPIQGGADERRWAPFLLLGQAGARLKAGQSATALTTRAFFDRELSLGPSSRFAAAPKRLQLSLPLPRRLVASVPGGFRRIVLTRRLRTEAGTCPPKTVVVGIIDDGIAFGHERFRRADGTTRFEYFWNQNGEHPAAAAVPYGRDFAKAEIDQLLLASRLGPLVDETTFYRLTGMADFRQPDHKSVAWRLAHGTHVADLAAGYRSTLDRADRPLIGVQLPVAATAGMSGAGLDTYVLAAIDYILEQALLLTPAGAKPLPVVINFSYGPYLGPHNGTAPLERGIEDRIAGAQRPFSVVLPSGNSNMVPCHAELAPAVGETAELRVRLQPDSKAVTTIAVYLPVDGGVGAAGDRVAISVGSPAGAQTDWVEQGSAVPLTLPANVSLFSPALPPSYCTVSYAFQAPPGQGQFLIEIQPTAWDSPEQAGGPDIRLAPAGLWTIRIRNRGLPAGTALQAWIERSDKLYGYRRRGRQAYFVTDGFKQFDKGAHPVTDDEAPIGPVRHLRMDNGIATGDGPLVVGGFTRKALSAAAYSAGGPVLPAQAVPTGNPSARPDALAVTDDSRVHRGILAAGSRSGSAKAMNGTSVAAPQVTRAVADAFAAGLPFDRAALIAKAEADEAALPGWKPELPPGRGGAGRLDLASEETRPARF